MTSFLLDDVVAIDAGAITRALELDEQRRLRHVLVSHSHWDHTATLPFLIENIFGANEEPVSIYSTKRVLGMVRNHLFNNDTWPDFSRIPNQLYPAVRFIEVEPDEPFVISGLPSGDLEVIPIPVNHIVSTVGFLMRQGKSSILYTSDTGPTEYAWKVVDATSDITACITECSFPNQLQKVADVSLHLTPQSLAVELAKITRDVPIYLYHFKPPYVEELRSELNQTALPHPVEELEQDRVYLF